MGRIRTVKPEFFIHEGLFDLEMEIGAPVRLAFQGLWPQCDREGRFKWRPRALKSQILPYDDCDFSRVLDALATRGFLVRYACRGEEYGWIPTWHDHQSINNKEKQSLLPSPDDPESQILSSKDVATRSPRVVHASSTRACNSQGERKGKERKGKESRVENASSFFGLEVPECLSSESFLKVWADWCKHRSEIRKKLTKTSVKQQLRELSEMGADRAIAAIQHTIAKGWQGIREPDPKETQKAPDQKSFAEYEKQQMAMYGRAK